MQTHPEAPKTVMQALHLLNESSDRLNTDITITNPMPRPGIGEQWITEMLDTLSKQPGFRMTELMLKHLNRESNPFRSSQ